MANFKTHLMAGMAVGAGLYLIKADDERTKNPEQRFDWGGLAVWSLVGGIAASLPDLLEPASSPNHRRLFHSLTFALVILYVIFGETSQWLKDKLGDLPFLAGCCYLSHLGLDIITPMGLPIV